MTSSVSFHRHCALSTTLIGNVRGLSGSLSLFGMTSGGAGWRRPPTQRTFMSQRTALCLVNFSGQDINQISASDISGFETPSGDPGHFLTGSLAADRSLSNYVEINNSGRSCFTVSLSFGDGTRLRFTSDQQDARTYQHSDASVVGRVIASDESRHVWQLCGGYTNGLYVRANQVPDHSSWMRDLVKRKPNVRLNELVLPGSHDAGMYTVTANWTLGAGDEWAQTQTLPFFGQLTAGSRYFDVRAYIYKKQLITGHGTGSYGAYGGYLSEIIDDVKRFLGSEAGKNEVVILKFSHTYYTDAASLTRVVDAVKTFGNLLYTTSDSTAN